MRIGSSFSFCSLLPHEGSNAQKQILDLQVCDNWWDFIFFFFKFPLCLKTKNWIQIILNVLITGKLVIIFFSVAEKKSDILFNCLLTDSYLLAFWILIISWLFISLESSFIENQSGQSKICVWSFQLFPSFSFVWL